MPGAEQEIADIRCSQGELRFVAAIGDQACEVYFRTETPLTPTADAAVAASLLPAMRRGGSLSIASPVSEQLLRGLREYEAVQRAWSLEWMLGEEPLREIEVRAAARKPEPRPPTGRVAVLFSGGVDSFSTITETTDVTDLIFIRGFDLHPTDPARAELRATVDDRLRRAAAELELPLHVVETNLRELSDQNIVWDCFFGSAVASVGLFMAPLFDRVVFTSDIDYEVQEKYGASWLVDQLLRTEETEIAVAGGRTDRVQRTRRAASHPVGRRALRVCWENRGGAYNCGRCRKCLMTMITLEALGLRESVETFPPDLDLGAVSGISIRQPIQLSLWEDVLDATRAAGRSDLERAAASVVSAGRDRLGLPRGYRRRRLPGPPPAPGPEPSPAQVADEPVPLFATPITAAALAATPGLCMLIGGYDGSGNFGDVAMADAALQALEPLRPEVLAVPVLERPFRASHELIRGQMQRPPEHVVYFDAGGGPEDGLVRVHPPCELRTASCYLYGGGYLNGYWGGRKLEMLAAAEGLLAATGVPRIRRVATGLQVEIEWLEGLDPDGRARLGGFELLGARDPRSAWALERLGLTLVTETGDDAVGVLRSCLAAAPARAPGEKALRVNVQFSGGEWVSPDAERGARFEADLVRQVGERLGRPVLAQPFIAYQDLRVDERPETDRLTAELRQRGVELADEPVLLRPGNLPAVASSMAGAELTVSRSYHVALTSLMLGVPAVLAADNPYYAQKAAGLSDAFGLPPAFSPPSHDDPAACAAEIAAALGGSGRDSLALAIARGTNTMRRRRDVTEAELLSRLCPPGSEAEAPLGAGRVPSPPAIREEGARQIRAAEGRTRIAEQRAAALERQVWEMRLSHSWRVTAPLRRLSRRLRRS